MAYANELLSGQITVTTAGTEVQGTDCPGQGFYIRALSTNTGKMYVGNNGSGAVSSSLGFELSAGDTIYIEVLNLSMVWIDSSVNGEKVCWLKALAGTR